jgi:GNAT superfamily N-acetyltransferase
MKGVSLHIFPEAEQGGNLYRGYLLRAVNANLKERIRYFCIEYYSQQTTFCLIEDKTKKILAATAIQESPYNSRVCWTTFTGTDPEYRGKGLAAWLVRARFEYMRKVYPGRALQISSYTCMGALIMQPLIRKIAKEFPDVPITENGFSGNSRQLEAMKEEFEKTGVIPTFEGR